MFNFCLYVLQGITEEKIQLEEKRDRRFDRVIRISDIGVRILMWIFKD